MQAHIAPLQPVALAAFPPWWIHKELVVQTCGAKIGFLKHRKIFFSEKIWWFHFFGLNCDIIRLKLRL
jgi:hypothetical protein